MKFSVGVTHQLKVLEENESNWNELTGSVLQWLTNNYWILQFGTYGKASIVNSK